MYSEQFVYPSYIRWQGNSVIMYKGGNYKVGDRVFNGKNLVTDRKKAYNGEVSKNSIRVARRRLNEWLEVIRVGNEKRKGRKIRLVLITLTLATDTKGGRLYSDKNIKAHLLEPLLKWLKYNYKIENYFWRAEPQQNGNIHFHIVTDRFIDKKKLQEYWNKKLKAHGLMNDYILKFNKDNPPSTHVKVFNAQPEEIDYLVKYVTKSKNVRKIEGLQMRFSNSIKYIEPISSVVSFSEENDLIAMFEDRAQHIVDEEYFKVFFFDSPAVNLFRLDSLFPNINRYRAVVYELVYTFRADSWVFDLVRQYFRSERSEPLEFPPDLVDSVGCPHECLRYLQRLSLIKPQPPQPKERQGLSVGQCLAFSAQNVFNHI